MKIGHIHKHLVQSGIYHDEEMATYHSSVIWEQSSFPCNPCDSDVEKNFSTKASWTGSTKDLTALFKLDLGSNLAMIESPESRE